jgi:glycogen debranching enzyme
MRTCDATGSGLYVWPEGMGCCGLDDALQWCENFPVTLQPGESWTTKDWGHPALHRFESVDINCQLYLEMKALALIASTLERSGVAEKWEARAAKLGECIHTQLFNPEAGIYQARSIVDGRFNGMTSLESFLPIYAGITPQSLAQQICRDILLDPERFYTTLPFSTQDRSHEAFRSSGSLYEPPAYPGALVQQAYWIGRTWLNYSYWMVGALHQAGLASEADAAAEKILDAVSRNESIYECYDPLTAAGTGHAEFPWGAASTLALLFGLYRNGPLPAHP